MPHPGGQVRLNDALQAAVEGSALCHPRRCHFRLIETAFRILKASPAARGNQQGLSQLAETFGTACDGASDVLFRHSMTHADIHRSFAPTMGEPR